MDPATRPGPGASAPGGAGERCDPCVDGEGYIEHRAMAGTTEPGSLTKAGGRGRGERGFGEGE